MGSKTSKTSMVNAHELFIDLDFDPIGDHDFGANASRVQQWFAARYSYIVVVGEFYLIAQVDDDDGLVDLIRFDRNGVEYERAHFRAADEFANLTEVAAAGVRAVAMAWGNK